MYLSALQPIFLLTFGVLFSQTQVETENPIPENMEVRIFDGETQKYVRSLYPFGETRAPFSITTGDINGDGKDDIIVGSARGYNPLVRVLSGDGTILNEFLAYQENFTGGVRVASCDLNNDGKDEIITGAGPGGGPHIMIFTSDGTPLLAGGFFAFDKNYRGGVKIGCENIDNTAELEIIVSTDLKTEPEIRFFTKTGEKVGSGFKPEGFDSYMGINFIPVDMNNDDRSEIALAGGYNNAPWVKIYDSLGHEVRSFLAYNETFNGGVFLAKYTSVQQNFLITGAGIRGGPHVKLFNTEGELEREFFAFSSAFQGGVSVATGDLDGDGEEEILARPGAFPEKSDSVGKSIEVDVTTQELAIYDDGFRLMDFLISSGKRGFDTPLGEFSVWRKRPLVTMSWYYGPDNPHNYRLPDVPWVLSFSGPYTIHGTYWHSNFGTRMSHGCVNMYTPDVQWIYDWAPIGTPVVIKE